MATTHTTFSDPYVSVDVQTSVPLALDPALVRLVASLNGNVPCSSCSLSSSAPQSPAQWLMTLSAKDGRSCSLTISVVAGSTPTFLLSTTAFWNADENGAVMALASALAKILLSAQVQKITMTWK